MKVSMTAFDRAWFLIKSQPIGLPFSSIESMAIEKALVQMMDTESPISTKASELMWQYLNHA
tara:strand:+ start:333 stop:518 length:186 start_codon:yes stop_codon:yes gene_type:complete